MMKDSLNKIVFIAGAVFACASTGSYAQSCQTVSDCPDSMNYACVSHRCVGIAQPAALKDCVDETCTVKCLKWDCSEIELEKVSVTGQEHTCEK